MNSPDVKIGLFLNDARNSYFLEDLTGLYSPTNTGGYGLPGGPGVNDITGLTITLNYTQLGTNLVYVFTIADGTITDATMALGGSTPTNIISVLPSTVWPFTSANRFELTGDYGVTLPSLSDQVYEVTYEITGEYLTVPFDFSAQTVDLYDVNTVCCASTKAIQLNINDIDKENRILKVYGWLITAHSAVENDLIDKANNYINRAATLCSDLQSCGCSK